MRDIAIISQYNLREMREVYSHYQLNAPVRVWTSDGSRAAAKLETARHCRGAFTEVEFKRALVEQI